MCNPPYSHQPMPLNLKSLRTRFTLRFLRALKKINQTQSKKQDFNYSHNIGNNVSNKNSNNHNNTILVSRRFKKVKLAADASLASAVGPRRAWTRAILLRTKPGRHARGRRVVVTRRKHLRRVHAPAEAGDGQTEELRRLVPGGEAMDMQSLLDETLHYVKCLTTQVKVMRSIVDFCNTPSS